MHSSMSTFPTDRNAALADDDRRGRLAVAWTALVMELPWSLVADTGAPAQAAEDPWDPAAGILTAAAGIVESDADLGSEAPRASATAAVPERWSLGLDAPWTPPRPARCRSRSTPR